MKHELSVLSQEPLETSWKYLKTYKFKAWSSLNFWYILLSLPLILKSQIMPFRILKGPEVTGKVWNKSVLLIPKFNSVLNA